MTITIIYDNKVSKQGLKADWGFSCLVESEGIPLLLFDTGASGSILLHNMRCLGINPDQIGIVVISHAHMDHAGGLSSILELNRNASIYVPHSFARVIPERKVIRIKNPLQIRDKVFTTGELDGIEQSLAIDTSSGIIVVTGCSHPGVGKIIDAASKYGSVHGIVGGLHGFHEFERLSGMSVVCPCHCTMYKSEIKSLFPKQCVDCGAGLLLNL